MRDIIELKTKQKLEQSPLLDLQQRTEVEIKKRKDNKFPMIVIKNHGYLHSHANEFLLTRYYHPTSFLEGLSSVQPTTIKNMADHLRYWLNICALNGKSYLYADYEFLAGVLKTLREVVGTEESSLSNYLLTWRSFYKYLDQKAVPHNMILPGKPRVERVLSDAEHKGDFLNYTKKTNSSTVAQDPLIDTRRVKKKSSYISQVLSLEQLSAFITELRKIDVVYGVMAKVQLDTVVRISELSYLPHTKNPLNPNFIIYGEMYTNQIDMQKFNFVGKGGHDREIDIDIRTLKLIEETYLTAKMPGSDTTIYLQRKQKFLTKFLISKNGKKSKYQPNDDILWLSEAGTPVSNSMYQAAFRKAVATLRKRGVIPMHIMVRPHSMRHTGVSLRLVKWRENTGVDIHVDNSGDIHAFLQSLLGHIKMETTYRYIRTVRDKTFQNLGLRTIIRNEEVWTDEIQSNEALAKGVEAIKQD